MLLLVFCKELLKEIKPTQNQRISIKQPPCVAATTTTPSQILSLFAPFLLLTSVLLWVVNRFAFNILHYFVSRGSSCCSAKARALLAHSEIVPGSKALTFCRLLTSQPHHSAHLWHLLLVFICVFALSSL